MFSKYKKSDAASGPTAAQVAAAKAIADAPAPDKNRQSLMKVKPESAPAQAAPMDKEKKRKERLGDIKLELHKALLDNLNLSALENASENELRQEIQAIATESLEEMGIVLNREERTALHQDLFFEVTGLGPLETLLKDESVNDILVNGPQQIFVERSGQAGTHRRHIQRRKAPAADHRQNRLRRGSSR